MLLKLKIFSFSCWSFVCFSRNCLPTSFAHCPFFFCAFSYQVVLSLTNYSYIHLLSFRIWVADTLCTIYFPTTFIELFLLGKNISKYHFCHLLNSCIYIGLILDSVFRTLYLRDLFPSPLCHILKITIAYNVL